LCYLVSVRILSDKSCQGCLRFMNGKQWGKGFRLTALVSTGVLLAGSAAPATKNMAVVAPAGSKLQDVPLAELAKLCKGAQKTWADGRNFTLVMRDPESPELRVAVQKLFGIPPSEVKSVIAKLNETRAVVRIVESDEELLRTVEATPGAVGILDVYAINSTVKVLRVDGKLPFDVGYALKGN
jgi:ribosomal protein L23